MFRRVDKHKQNDQNGIIHPFGKPTKKTEKDTDFHAPKIFYDSRKVYIDSRKVNTEKQKDPQPILQYICLSIILYIFSLSMCTRAEGHCAVPVRTSTICSDRAIRLLHGTVQYGTLSSWKSK